MVEINLPFILEAIGTVAAAISGIRLAATKRFDWFGAYTIGLVTAIGGGTLRDLLLDIPVFWMQTWWYLAATALSLATVIIFRKLLVSQDKILFIFDSIGLALFCDIGIHKTLAIGYPMWVATVMGIITGAFGGVIRDILINEEPLVFRKDIYATACLAGALVYWLLLETGFSDLTQQLACAATIIFLRVLALKYNLSLPILTGYSDPSRKIRKPRK
ncbi:MAG: trimeric intracellular cation channel family protein [Muribaculaceae bacterium]|nr:trimeric intracellular cation channel family protein [Bacteroides sp.]MDE6226076.1 trimeric intracellular cation channel family protein [Muribaculaceae bacterium]